MWDGRHCDPEAGSCPVKRTGGTAIVRPSGVAFRRTQPPVDHAANDHQIIVPQHRLRTRLFERARRRRERPNRRPKPKPAGPGGPVATAAAGSP